MKIRNNIKQHFPVQHDKIQQHNTTPTTVVKKSTSNKNKINNKKKDLELEKMQKFMSKFRVPKVADSALTITPIEGSSDSLSSSEESPSLRTSARQPMKSESSGLQRQVISGGVTGGGLEK